MGDRLATIYMGRTGEGLLWELYNVAWVDAYLFAKWHLDPSNRLATIVGIPRTLLHVRIPLRTIFILSLAVKTKNICNMRALSYCSIPIKIK